MIIRLMIAACFLLGTWPVASAALTAEEIILLKQNGVSEKTIQMMIQSEMRAQERSATGQRLGTEMIERPNGQPAIVYSTGGGNRTDQNDAQRLQEERAWEMLRHIIVDNRAAGSHRKNPKD